jgi:glycosyltransferase involved in cell wall biosynthesis
VHAASLRRGAGRGKTGLVGHRYRFGFVLSTGAGNRTRYLNLRKYAERDPEVECTWATNPGVANQGSLRARVETLRLAAPVLRALDRLDAAVFHGFEPYAWAALRSLVARRPLLVWSQDDPPTRDPRFWLHYGLAERSRLRTELRYRVDRWCAGRVELFFPYTRWAAEALTRDCGIAEEKVHALHVGVDLEAWPRVGARGEGHRPRVLFVGGDFRRKGGDLLVEVFRRRFAGRAELHLVTAAAPPSLPADVFVHLDLQPNQQGLTKLFAQADVFVLPTRGDLSPFVVLEAMASGLPVVATAITSVPEMVQEGETGFLVAPDDGEALAARIEQLLGDPELRRRMGERGRARVEAEYSAAVTVPRMLARMKRAVDQVQG